MRSPNAAYPDFGGTCRACSSTTTTTTWRRSRRRSRRSTATSPTTRRPSARRSATSSSTPRSGRSSSTRTARRSSTTTSSSVDGRERRRDDRASRRSRPPRMSTRRSRAPSTSETPTPDRDNPECGSQGEPGPWTAEITKERRAVSPSEPRGAVSVAAPAPESAEPILRLRGVGRRFGGVQAVRDVDLDVVAGERRAVLGPNGAGKTTLFNVIAGEFPPSDGVDRAVRTRRDRRARPQARRARADPHLPDVTPLPRPLRRGQPLPLGRRRRGWASAPGRPARP